MSASELKVKLLLQLRTELKTIFEQPQKGVQILSKCLAWALSDDDDDFVSGSGVPQKESPGTDRTVRSRTFCQTGTAREFESVRRGEVKGNYYDYEYCYKAQECCSKQSSICSLGHTHKMNE